MYLRLVFIHLWLILSARAVCALMCLGVGFVWTSGVGGCERLAMGPAGATSQISLVRRGRRCRWVGLVLLRQGCVVGTLGRRRHLGGRADVVVSQGEGTGAS